MTTETAQAPTNYDLRGGLNVNLLPEGPHTEQLPRQERLTRFVQTPQGRLIEERIETKRILKPIYRDQDGNIKLGLMRRHTSIDQIPTPTNLTVDQAQKSYYLKALAQFSIMGLGLVAAGLGLQDLHNLTQLNQYVDLLTIPNIEVQGETLLATVAVPVGIVSSVAADFWRKPLDWAYNRIDAIRDFRQRHPVTA